MTKLVEWLSLGSAFIAFWLYLLKGDAIEVTDGNRLHILLLPLYLVILFGLVSLFIVIYRTLTFNDCPEAYEELKRQIKEAKADLTTKGFKFKET